MSKQKKTNGNKEISGKNVLIIFLIVLALFGAYCFIHFANEASKTDSGETSQSETYDSLIQ